jgi:hypothetical protein
VKARRYHRVNLFLHTSDAVFDHHMRCIAFLYIALGIMRLAGTMADLFTKATHDYRTWFPSSFVSDAATVVFTCGRRLG